MAKQRSKLIASLIIGQNHNMSVHKVTVGLLAQAHMHTPQNTHYATYIPALIIQLQQFIINAIANKYCVQMQ